MANDSKNLPTGKSRMWSFQVDSTNLTGHDVGAAEWNRLKIVIDATAASWGVSANPIGKPAAEGLYLLNVVIRSLR